MATPIPASVYDYLEEYGILETDVRASWIDKQIFRYTRYIREQTGLPVLFITAKHQKVEIHSHPGTYEDLILDYQPILSVDAIRFLSNVAVQFDSPLINITIIEGGMLRLSGTMWPKGNKHIEVTYTHGYETIPNDLEEVLLLLVVARTLGFLSGRTGGGNSLIYQHFLVVMGSVENGLKNEAN